MNRAVLVMVGVLAAAGAGCGSDTSCGEGTVKMNGTCVPADGSCGAGTVLADGICVPDGSVVCQTGTTFDMATGTCVPDITGCGTGTVLVGGECVPEDQTPTADVTEPAEPNGFEVGATTAVIPLPAEGDDVVISGCIELRPDYDLDDNVDADYDVFAITVTEPTLLEITVDGVGGMAGGFRVLPLGFTLRNQNWQRGGINLVGDTAQREVLLPRAGDYLLAIADSRSLALGDGFGDGVDTCYFATVAHLPMPAPTVVSGAQVTGTMSDKAQFFRYDPADGERIFATLRLLTESPAIIPSIGFLYQGAYAVSSTYPSDTVWERVYGLSSGEPVTIVVEHAQSYQLQPVDFVVDLEVSSDPQASMSPTTLSVPPGFHGVQRWIDASAGDIIRVDFDDLGNGDPHFDVRILGISGFHSGTALDNVNDGTGFVQIMEDGRYTIRVRNNNTSATDPLDVSLGYGVEQSTPMTLGTPITGAALDESGSSFFELELTDVPWLSMSLSATGFGGTASYYLVPRELRGVAPTIGPFTGDAEVVLDDLSGTFLVVVTDSDVASASSPTFDLSIAAGSIDDRRGAISEGSPLDENGVTLPAGGALHYRFDVMDHTDFDISAVGSGLDLVIDLHGPGGSIQTVDAAGAGAAETVGGSTGRPSALFGFTVREASGAAGTVDIDLVVDEPTYARTEGRANPDNACLSGERLTLTGGLSAVQDLGFTFPYFGENKSQIVISERGYVSFDPAYSGAGMANTAGPWPSSAWRSVDVCIHKAADHVTVQWRGIVAQPVIRTQLILWQDGRIEMIYGPGGDMWAGFPTLNSPNGSEVIEYQPKSVPGTQVVYAPNP